MKNSDLNKLRQRDQHCWHCGAEQDLVPHHRANRGFGGSKALDNLQNVIMVCSLYNGLMESDALVADEAREAGHKLGKFSSPNASVFDKKDRRWYRLDEKGNKHETEQPTNLF